MDNANGVLPDVLDPSQELDFSQEGFQTPLVNWLITKAEVTSPQPGRQQLVFTLTTEHEGAEFTVQHRLWYTFSGSPKGPATDQKVTQIGRGQYKRLLLAALGQPTGSMNSLVGKYIAAEGTEDDAGFRRLTRIQPPIQAQDAGEL